jgi:carbonic anhydrase/acetyltransferase-like protein (isoleucine patch superfamily)
MQWRSTKVLTEDPTELFGRLLTKTRTRWMRLTYPFAGCGKDISIHYTCEIHRSASNRIQIDDSVVIAAGAWLNVPEPAIGAPPTIVLQSGCKIGRRCMISAKNSIWLENDVLLGPSVIITDHSHEFSNVTLPIHTQGLTPGGAVRIERNCWLGHGAAVICTSGELVIGRNSVIGANAVVTQSVPPFSVVAGNPAKVIRRYRPETGRWAKA